MELDDGRPKEAKQQKPEEALPKKCQHCHHMKPPKTPVCPKCGFKAAIRAEVETEDGELVLMSKGKKAPSMQDKQKFYSELLAIKMARGHSDGWVSHKYKAKFGVWPKGMMDYAIEPSPEVVSWVRSQNIRFAKSKELRHAA
jgi:hypothetical protein